MSLIMLFSFSLLLVALHGSLAAVLRGRRPNIDPSPGNPAIHFVLDAPEQARSDPDDILDKVFQKISSTLGEVDKRQSSNVQVSEADMLQLINDVNAIGGQLQEWLENGGGSSQPEVSETPRGTLTSRVTGPSTTRAPTPAATTTPCMVTVTETYYEYIYADTSMVPKRLPTPVDEVEPFAATVAFPSAMTESLDEPVAASTMTPSKASTNPISPTSSTSLTAGESALESVISEVPGSSSTTPTSTLMSSPLSTSPSTSLSTSPSTLQDSPNEATGIIWQTIALPP